MHIVIWPCFLTLSCVERVLVLVSFSAKNQNSALEVSLMDDKNTTRLLTTTFIHPATEQMETISMPYMVIFYEILFIDIIYLLLDFIDFNDDDDGNDGDDDHVGS